MTEPIDQPQSPRDERGRFTTQPEPETPGFKPQIGAAEGMNEFAEAFYQQNAEPGVAELAPEQATTPEVVETEGPYVDAEPGVESDDDDPVVEVVVQGEKLEVPFSELVNGYSRQADYTRKSQRLAEERKYVEDQAAQVNVQSAQAASRMVALAEQLENDLASLGPTQQDLEVLRSQNPGEYAATLADLQRKHQLIEMAKQEKVAAEQNIRRQRVPIERALLAQEVPVFAEDFNQHYTDLGRWITDPNGGKLTPEQWDGADDHLFVRLAWMAKQYADNLQQTRQSAPRVRKKVAKLPNERPGSPPEPGEAQVEGYQAAVQNMQEHQTPDSIAQAFLAREQMKRNR